MSKFEHDIATEGIPLLWARSEVIQVPTSRSHGNNLTPVECKPDAGLRLHKPSVAVGIRP